MPNVIVHAIESSILQANTPSAQQIDAALNAVNFGGGNWGGWVGPRARITRQAIIGQSFQTHAAYLYQWPDNAFTAAHIDYMRAQLLAQVQQMLQPTGDWTVTLEGYAPATNGSIDWWSSGNASITTTRDDFPTTTGRVDATENPTGPTTAATHPSTPGQVAAGIGSGLSSILSPVTLLVVAVAAVILGPDLLKASKGRGASAPSRPAPQRATVTVL